jgi:hypothetical protein
VEPGFQRCRLSGSRPKAIKFFHPAAAIVKKPIVVVV